jgi:hypothetical protein
MRCLYCGKELALLKRLRGGGDFCSDAHKQSYQEEYNRLALSRLLQAQKKGQQTNSPAQSAPPADASIAVEEPVEDEAAIGAESSPVLEVAVGEASVPEVSEDVMDSATVDESTAEAETSPEDSLSAEPEPSQAAGFLLESPAIAAATTEDSPYLEPWLELSPGPAMSEWQLQNGSFSLSSADLVAVDLRPTPASIQDHASTVDLITQAFAGAPPNPSLSWVPNTKKISNTSRFPTGSVRPINVAPIEIAPNSGAWDADQSFVQAVGFESTVLLDHSRLLELAPASIDFPGADSDVAVLPLSYDDEAPAELTPAKAEAEQPGQDDSPRASLEALSRLHQELIEQEAARTPEAMETPSSEPAEAPVEIVEAAAAEPVAPPSPDAEVVTEEHRPKFSTELFEIAIKTFPPAKPSPIGGQAFPSNAGPLLPNLKFLPLRPKVALATGYVPPTKASVLSDTKPADKNKTETKPADPKPAAPAAAPVRTPAPSKPASGKPPARLTQPKQPSQPAKPVQPAAAKTAETRSSAAAPKAASPSADAAKPAAKPAVSQPTPPQEAGARPKVPEAAQKPAAAVSQPQPATDKAKPLSEPTKPAADKPKPATDRSKPAEERAKTKPDQADTDIAPSFGITQPENIPWAGSLKVKLGIAIVLLLLACIYFLGWGHSKPAKTSSSNAAASADGAGPSIILGEGGWVEGWAGDPNGMHAGRQITIYRPSLKLSDYRLAFQGSIDTKSIGWVFRASDPDNYYAMKLMLVSSGLSPKVALFKYLVSNGRQTQVGRVPIDVAVQADTQFDIRVDVRGPKFTTYIQGQQVDIWTDDQLKTGGAGFLNEREERGKVKSVSIRYLSGAK